MEDATVMTLDKYKRVLWRLRELPATTSGAYAYRYIRQAIMEEIGTDERTINQAILRMGELQLLEKAEIGCLRVCK